MQEAQKLIGFDLEATPDGGAKLTIRTLIPSEDAPRAIHQTVMDLEPFVADVLRNAMLREIPDRPAPHQSFEDVTQRLIELEIAIFG